MKLPGVVHGIVACDNRARHSPKHPLVVVDRFTVSQGVKIEFWSQDGDFTEADHRPTRRGHADVGFISRDGDSIFDQLSDGPREQIRQGFYHPMLSGGKAHITRTIECRVCRQPLYVDHGKYSRAVLLDYSEVGRIVTLAQVRATLQEMARHPS